MDWSGLRLRCPRRGVFPGSCGDVGRADQGEVRLFRRRAPECDVVWQFPAGKVQAGESVE
ncbi:NUDIX hydrolase [Streptomyces sp. NPDC005122]